MPPELLPVVIFPALFAAIAYITKVISDNRTRRRLIASGATTDAIEALFVKAPLPDYETARRNGYVGLAVGLAFLIIALAGLGPASPLSYALLALAYGAAQVLFSRTRTDS
ncbi:MAG: hypothetical protein V2I82_05370 [Halieaceae bacterium]|jgi:hypothetical protein|nr:hypothetical protein [Halieaceae bacterium]